MRLTIREAAQVSGVSCATIRRHIRAGILEAYGRRIDERDLYAYSLEQWERGRVMMYPPQEGFVRRLEDIYELKA